MVQTRKSTRVRFPTTKAKQLEESITKKPILRSISTIDEDENTYNNINFKKRRLNNDQSSLTEDTKKDKEQEVEEQDDDEEEDYKPNFNVSSYDFKIDNDSDIEDEIFGTTDEENIFNSEDEEYYSALSDYESDSSKSKSNSFPTSRYYSNTFVQKNTTAHPLSQSSLLTLDSENLFDSADDGENNSDSSINSNSDSNSPINTNFNFVELKSLEENFQRIIDENKKLESPTISKDVVEPLSTDTYNSISSSSSIDDFVDYLSNEELNSSLINTTTTANSNSSQKPKFLQYRHDERHNLAFTDVSTFPIRYDPSSNSKNFRSKLGPRNPKNFMIRALKRRAIQTGMASEMVGTGISFSDDQFNFF